MIDYQNITDNEIKRIVSCAANPAAQVLILKDLTGKSLADIKRACGMIAEGEAPSGENKWGRWSDKEIDYLHANADIPLEKQAEKLGRSIAGITNMRRKLGIISKSGWSEADKKKLISLYNKKEDDGCITQSNRKP